MLDKTWVQNIKKIRHSAYMKGAYDLVVLEARTEGIRLDGELIEAFLLYLENKGRCEGSLQNYRMILNGLYEILPEDKLLDDSTAAFWRTWLKKQGYSPSTINTRLSVLNSLLRFLDHKEWQNGEFLLRYTEAQPELTRAEYMRMLQVARQQGKERVYLLIKTLGGAGVRIQELPQLTAEAVKLGVCWLECHGRRRILHIPKLLQNELLDFMDKEGINTGPLFAKHKGEALDRSAVWSYVNSVSAEAQVPPEKCNPRCLWKLYQNTRKRIENNIAALVEQAYIRVLEEEQLVVGWQS